MRTGRKLRIGVLGLWIMSQFLLLVAHSTAAKAELGADFGRQLVKMHCHGVAEVPPAGQHDHANRGHVDGGIDSSGSPIQCDTGCMMFTVNVFGALFHPLLAVRFAIGPASDPLDWSHFLTSPPPESFA